MLRKQPTRRTTQARREETRCSASPHQREVGPGASHAAHPPCPRPPVATSPAHMRPGPPRREGCPPSPTFVSPGRGVGLEEGLEFDAGPGDCARSRAIAARIWALGCCLPRFPGRLGEWRGAHVRQPEAWRQYPSGIATGIVAWRERRPLLMDGRNPGHALLQRRGRSIPVAEFIPLGCTASASACVQMRAPCAHRVNPANQLHEAQRPTPAPAPRNITTRSSSDGCLRHTPPGISEPLRSRAPTVLVPRGLNPRRSPEAHRVHRAQ